MTRKDEEVRRRFNDYIAAHPQEKYSPAEVARGARLKSREMARLLLREAGLPILSHRESTVRAGRRRSSATDKQVNASGGLGVTLKKIAEVTGRAVSTVINSERRRGIRRRDAKGTTIEEKIRRHAGSGKTQREIADEEGIHQTTVSKHERGVLGIPRQGSRRRGPKKS